MRESSDTASQRSSEGGASQTSSQRSDSKFLKRRGQVAQAETGENGAADLLEQRRNVVEGVFACMYTLTRTSALSSWKWAVLKVLLEFLMNFRVVFNSASGKNWKIDTNSPVWKVVTWILWRAPVARIYGYHVYVIVLYIMVSAVLLSLVSLAWLMVAMRRQEQSKWLRTASLVLHVVYDIMFVTCYVSFFDYFTFMASCYFTGTKHHTYFPSVACMEMPHLLHMAVALVTGVIFMCVTALMLVASCDLDPVSHGYLASPAAYARLKILFTKAVYVVVANCLASNSKLQALGVLLCISLVCFWNLRAMPFYRSGVNVMWTGLWGGNLYPGVLLVMMAYSKDTSKAYRRKLSKDVLYGIWPVVLFSIALVWLYNRWAMRPARKFKNLAPGVKMSRVHKFESVYEVERLARVMRVFDADGLVEQEAAALGEVVIKAGMQAFPNSPHLLILYANFVLEARKDGPAARTQLQLAAKAAPNIVERYQIFCTIEASKKLKDTTDGGMDLQAYIEFKRNFRAVLRVHKEAMLQQAEMWQLFMRPSIRVEQVDRAMEVLETATARAHQVYKRVLDRYPNNGKLLRCYGKFLEDCRHDQIAAAKAYGEANRNGGAANSGLLALDLGGASFGDAGSKPDFLTSMSVEDDAVVVTDAEGKILMVSQAVQAMFGYAKTELEGANVSVLMPQPFSQRHPGYMARCVADGEPHILDNVRQMVALHKERYVFPVALCATRLSGTGPDSIFLGVFRPLAPKLSSQRAWVTPNGVFLCADQHFASAVGIMEGELVGHTLTSLVADPEDVERLLQRCREVASEVLESGSIQAHLLLLHRYLDPVPVDVTVCMAGSDSQRILVLHCVRTDGQDGGMLAADSHMRIRFASCEVAMITGYPPRRLAAMKLGDLLPPPYNALHAKWLRDPPRNDAPGSCRAGAVVHLVSEAGVQIPVKIHVKTVDRDAVGATGTGAASTLHIVQVTKLSPDEVFADKRLVLTADFSGRVVGVSPPGSAVFGFPSDSLLGTCLSDSIDLFDDWRQRSGEGQLQLLLLALLDKEAELPGTSWRVKVHAPCAPDGELPPLPGQAKAARKGVVSKTACLQVDLLEGDGDDACEGASGSGSSSRVLVTLWRRDLLSGVVELDEELTVRKASPITALITGLPVTAMTRRPLGRLLHLPPAATSWDSLVSACSAPAKKSALKASSERGSISPLMAFIGPHPDTGTMRLMVQGVQTLGPTGRPKVTLTLHPDATFVGAHADLMRVLKLDAAGPGVHARHAGESEAAAAVAALADEGAIDDQPSRCRSGRKTAAESAVGNHAAGVLEPSAPAGDVGGTWRDEHDIPPSRGLHRQATSRSEFVEQWVKAVTKQLNDSQRCMSVAPDGALPGTSHFKTLGATDETLEGTVPDPGAAHNGLVIMGADSNSAPCTDPSQDPGKAVMHRDVSSAKPRHSRHLPREVQSPTRAADRPKHSGKGGSDNDGDGNKSDKDSENDASSVDDGSQAVSGISGTSDANSAADLVVDARRGRLLKALNKLLLGPSLMTHVHRLHLHSYAIIALMFLAHLVAFTVLSSQIKEQHDHVFQVVDQAMAMDRSSLILCRVLIGSFCAMPGIMPVGVCSNPLNYTMTRMATAINEMEHFHQSVYLGVTSKVKAPAAEVYKVWTLPNTAYSFFTDTTPPQILPLFAGAWALGNRFIAAAREGLYLMPRMAFAYLYHRTSNFILMNGFAPLFEVYATSLDLLVESAWGSVQKLRTELVVLLVVEAVLIQLCCSLYELLLVRRLERARLLGVLAMLALPGPVLRQLVASDQRKIVDDSDDEAEESDSLAGDEDDKAHGAAAPDSGTAPPPGSTAVPSGKSVGPVTVQGPAGRNSAVGWHSTAPGASRCKADAVMGAESSQLAEPCAEETQAPSANQGQGLSIDASKSAAPEASRVAVATRGSPILRINGKVLVPSRWNVAQFMAPFFAWSIAVVLVYAISVSKLNGMQGPLASLNMAAHVTYRYTRIRGLSLGFLAEPVELRPAMREMLSNELALFESEYDALMYGGLPLSLMNSTFRHAAPAGTFESAAFARQFFTTKRCLRYNQSACLTSSSPYYEVTHNGLDVLVRRMMSELRLITLDADADVAYNNSRYSFMAAVAGNDMYEGLQQATQLFVDYSISRYDQVTKFHEVLLIVSVFLVLGFFGLLLWPHSRRTLRDASRQSGLLSLVPAEMDVRGHVRSVLKRSAAADRRK